MKHSLLFLIVFVTSIVQLRAQDDTVSFDLDDCIRYALENTVEVQNARIDEQIAKARVKETVGIGLPQIDGSVNITHNEKLPRFFMQYDPEQIGFFDPGDIPGIEAGDVVAFGNFLPLSSSGDPGIHVNQLIFNGSYLVGLKAADSYTELALKTTTQTQIQVIENVQKAYYAVLTNNGRIALVY